MCASREKKKKEKHTDKSREWEKRDKDTEEWEKVETERQIRGKEKETEWLRERK